MAQTARAQEAETRVSPETLEAFKTFINPANRTNLLSSGNSSLQAQYFGLLGGQNGLIDFIGQGRPSNSTEREVYDAALREFGGSKGREKTAVIALVSLHAELLSSLSGFNTTTFSSFDQTTKDRMRNALIYIDDNISNSNYARYSDQGIPEARELLSRKITGTPGTVVGSVGSGTFYSVPRTTEPQEIAVRNTRADSDIRFNADLTGALVDTFGTEKNAHIFSSAYIEGCKSVIRGDGSASQAAIVRDLSDGLALLEGTGNPTLTNDPFFKSARDKLNADPPDLKGALEDIAKIMLLSSAFNELSEAVFVTLKGKAFSYGTIKFDIVTFQFETDAEARARWVEMGKRFGIAPEHLTFNLHGELNQYYAEVTRGGFNPREGIQLNNPTTTTESALGGIIGLGAEMLFNVFARDQIHHLVLHVEEQGEGYTIKAGTMEVTSFTPTGERTTTTEDVNFTNMRFRFSGGAEFLVAVPPGVEYGTWRFTGCGVEANTDGTFIMYANFEDIYGETAGRSVLGRFSANLGLHIINTVDGRATGSFNLSGMPIAYAFKKQNGSWLVGLTGGVEVELTQSEADRAFFSWKAGGRALWAGRKWDTTLDVGVQRVGGLEPTAGFFGSNIAPTASLTFRRSRNPITATPTRMADDRINEVYGNVLNQADKIEGSKRGALTGDSLRYFGQAQAEILTNNARECSQSALTGDQEFTRLLTILRGLTSENIPEAKVLLEHLATQYPTVFTGR